MFGLRLYAGVVNKDSFYSNISIQDWVVSNLSVSLIHRGGYRWNLFFGIFLLGYLEEKEGVDLGRKREMWRVSLLYYVPDKDYEGDIE